MRDGCWRATLRRRVQFYHRALGYYRPDARLLALLLGLIVCSTLLGLAMAWPMAVLVDSVLTPNTEPDIIRRAFLYPLPASRLGQISGLAVIGLLLKLASDLIGTLRTILTNRINYNGLMRVRCDLYRKLQALSLCYHRSQPQGDAIYRLSSDTFGCQTILGVLISTFTAAITLAIMLWILLSRNASLTLAALTIAPPLITANVLFGRRLKRRTLRAKEVESEYTTAVQRSMSSIMLVQAFGREQEEYRRFHHTVRRSIDAWWRLNRQEILYWLVVGTMFGLGGAIVFCYGGYLVYRDQFLRPRGGGMTVGDLMVFTTYLAMLWDPLCKLTGIGPNIQGGVAGAQRVFEVLDRQVLITDRADARRLPVQPRVLAFEKVWFSYDALSVPGQRIKAGSGQKDAGDAAPGIEDAAISDPVLRDINVRIEPGQMVAFVGSSGVGKSTLLNLLPRFYDPQAGRVTLDGIDMRKIRLRDLRQHVALVLQESVLLPTSIAENIAYGRAWASHEQIRAAAKLAGAAAFIEQLPDQYDSVITEGGLNLSGGQRQRIAIARALLTSAPVLVLDEPTSALDARHEQQITETLGHLKGGRTIVIVSHRISTVVDCDQIFYMDEGRIAERGSHAELMALRGGYYAMAQHQIAAAPALQDVAAVA